MSSIRFGMALGVVVASLVGFAASHATAESISPREDRVLDGTIGPVPVLVRSAPRWNAPLAVLYDNGSIVTGVGNGSGGANTSSIGLGSFLFGLGHQVVNNNRVADDFMIAGGSWQIDNITFFAYQTGSTVVSTMTSVNLQIWNGPPGVVGSSVVWGDTTTNRLSSSAWTGTYRVQDSNNLTNTQRPIMANVVSVNTVLPPGTYWLDWQTGGTLVSGPFAPLISSLTLPPSGNGRQALAGVWGAPSELAEFPFLIDGTALGGFDCGELLSVVGQWGLTNSRCGDFVSNATAARYESSVQNFEAPLFEGFIGSYAYEVELVINRPRQPTASNTIFVAGYPFPPQTALQNWNSGIAFNFAANRKYSIYRYNGTATPVALQQWTVPVGVPFNVPPASNILRVEAVGGQLNFLINGTLVRTLPDTYGVGEFGIGFVRSFATTGNLATDDWVEVLDAQISIGQPPSPNRVSPAQQRANDEANAQRVNGTPLFAPADAPSGRF